MSHVNRLKITTDGEGQWSMIGATSEVIGMILKTEHGYGHSLLPKNFDVWWECYEDFCYVSHDLVGGPPPSLPKGYDPAAIPEGWTFEGEVRPAKVGEHYHIGHDVAKALFYRDERDYHRPIIVKVEEAAPRPAPALNAFEQAVLKLVYSEPQVGITTEGIYNSTVSFSRDYYWVKGAIEKLMALRLIRVEARRLDGRKHDFHLPVEPRPEVTAWLPEYGIEVAADDEVQEDALLPLDAEEQATLTETAIEELKRAYPFVVFLSGEGVMFFDSHEAMDRAMERLGMAPPPAPVAVHPEVLRDAIDRYLNEHDLAGDGHRFFTPTQWAGTGAFEDASLHLSFGGALYRLLSYGLNKTEEPDLEQDFYRLVERHGYEMKLGSDWSAHFYPKGFNDPAPAVAPPKSNTKKLLAILAAIIL